MCVNVYYKYSLKRLQHNKMKINLKIQIQLKKKFIATLYFLFFLRYKWQYFEERSSYSSNSAIETILNTTSSIFMLHQIKTFVHALY